LNLQFLRKKKKKALICMQKKRDKERTALHSPRLIKNSAGRSLHPLLSFSQQQKLFFLQKLLGNSENKILKA